MTVGTEVTTYATRDVTTAQRRIQENTSLSYSYQSDNGVVRGQYLRRVPSLGLLLSQPAAAQTRQQWRAIATTWRAPANFPSRN